MSSRLRVPLILTACLALASPLIGQIPLHDQIAAIAKDAKGSVYVACSLPGSSLDGDLNPHGHPPMQSVFKLPLALTVLQRVEHGDFSLDQPIAFLAADCYPGTYSPLQEAHPQGGVDVPLHKLLELAVGRSDNTAADILLRLIGGPAAVQASLDVLGLNAIHVRDSERSLHDDDTAQYRNDAEPAAMVALLRLLSDHSPLSTEHTALLLRWMTDSPVGAKRIKGLLPAGTTVAHRTGTSGEQDGRIPATNDVGLITLPDGRRLALAVFVTDATAPMEVCEAVIARIAKAVYEHAAAETTRNDPPGKT